MNIYKIRRAILAIASAVISLLGLALANTALTNLYKSIEAIPEDGVIAGSSEEFGLNLLGLAGGGAIFGFFMAISLALAIWSLRD